MSWNISEIELLKKMYKQGETCESIARALNKTIPAVRNKAWRLGITDNREYTEEEKAYIISNYKSYNLREIAEKLNRPKENICRFIREQGIERTGKKKNETYHQTRLYRIYHCMKERCYNVKNTAYKYYGGRGITICAEWLNDFQAFYKWAIANGYSETLTIDRVNVNGIYEPNNCRWATRAEQVKNRRCARKNAGA